MQQGPNDALMACVRWFKALMAIEINRELQEVMLKEFFLEGQREDLLEKIVAILPHTLDQAIGISTNEEVRKEMIYNITM